MAKVYFTRRIAPESVVEAYSRLGIELPGRVAVKVHSGEQGNQNFLKPAFWKPMVDMVHGTIVECNTAIRRCRRRRQGPLRGALEAHEGAWMDGSLRCRSHG